MVLHILRTLFVLLMGAVGWYYLQHPTQFFGQYTWLVMAMALTVGVFTVCVDILSPRRKLAIFSGAFLGLVVGIFVAYALSFVVRLVVEQQLTAPIGMSRGEKDAFDARRNTIIDFVNVIIGITTTYLSISFILQTKDDFRFIIPFVEFAKQTRGARPMLLDTSVLIDGRIADIAATGILESQLVVPRFVLDELQQIGDSGDRLKRNRGRRGLDVLAKLQANRKVEVVLYEGAARDDNPNNDVDTRLLLLGKELAARVLTNDLNLNKIAQLRNVDVININQLATSLRPAVLPGEKLSVRLVKTGDQAGQGIGFLDDGTMVVVEHGRSHLNENVDVVVTSSLQNNSGKMIFGRIVDHTHHHTHDDSPTPTLTATPALTPAPTPNQPSAAPPTPVVATPPLPHQGPGGPHQGAGAPHQGAGAPHASIPAKPRSRAS
jgi:uncharacterized protein YacL